MEENTNINVFEETKKNYLRSSKYVKAQVNVLDEIPKSYSHQGNPKLDKKKYTICGFEGSQITFKGLCIL